MKQARMNQARMNQAGCRSRAAALCVSVLVAAGGALQDQTATPTGASDRDFPGWPAQYDGRALQGLALTRRELVFAQDFPGRVGRFADGRREIIMRWVTLPTRRLHPAADCFRASGYSIAPLPRQRRGNATPIGCFRASRGDDRLKVCEMIRDEQGQTWSDVSAWYWHAILGTTRSPWWSVVTAEQG